MSDEYLSARDYARIMVAGHRAERARRIEATQRVVAVQRYGKIDYEPQCTTARLLRNAEQRMARDEERNGGLLSRLIQWIGRLWR